MADADAVVDDDECRERERERERERGADSWSDAVEIRLTSVSLVGRMSQQPRQQSVLR